MPTTAGQGIAAHKDGSIDDLVAGFSALWWESDTGTLPLTDTYSDSQRSSREAHFQHFVDTMSEELKRVPRTREQRGATRERIMSAFGEFARYALGFKERHLDLLLSPSGFTQVGVEFTQAARRFDPAVTASDIFQAMRNAWAMNGLQAMWGLPVTLTPAVFAYSMLYPYTDNYLDDPTISVETKRSFNRRFARRLRGKDVAPTNAHERNIYELVGMIEGQYQRSQYPQVYESLLAIHRAQEKSLLLLNRAASPYEVDALGISFEKGGASVLADGYLVAGSVTEAQAEFLFGYGTFLQLADDLQDVRTDSGDGLQTIFSQTLGRWPLDAVTNRLFNYGWKVMQLAECFDSPKADVLKELMANSGVSLVMNAAGAASEFYSDTYIEELESNSPFRFSFLREMREKHAGQRGSLMRMIEAFSRKEAVSGQLSAISG